MESRLGVSASSVLGGNHKVGGQRTMRDVETAARKWQFLSSQEGEVMGDFRHHFCLFSWISVRIIES